MILAGIFDLDDVTGDTERLASRAYHQVLTEHGATPTLKPCGSIHEVGIKGNMKRLKERYEIATDLEILKRRWSALYSQFIDAEVRSMPGLHQLLRILEVHGLRKAIVSNNSEEHIYRVLELLEICDRFEAVISADKFTRPKPYPDVYLAAARRLKLKPENCVVFEDTQYGVNAGSSACMKVIAVPTKFTKDHDFFLADKVCNSLADVSWEMLSTL